MSGTRHEQRQGDLVGSESYRGANFGGAASDYARYRAGFPERLYAELSRRGLRFSAPTRTEGGNAASPARVVDLGCGTGTLARGFAARGAEVTGVDISAELLSQAELVARAEGLEITWHQAAAEQTGLAAGAYDLVSAGQCWHWFDRPRAAREVLRLLRPGAAVLVAHFDYLVVPGGVVQATEEILSRECGEPTAAGYRFGTDGVYPTWFADLARAGFVALESGSFDEDVAYDEVAWRGRMRAQGHVSASDAATRARFDAALAVRIAHDGAGADLPRSADGRLRVPHRCFFITARAPAS